MKTFRIILLTLAVALFGKTLAHAFDEAVPTTNTLEIVLTDDKVAFDNPTNISMDMVFRNIGEKPLAAAHLLTGLSVVWDGKECRRDPKRGIVYNGLLEFYPQMGWRSHFSLSEFLVPRKALGAGRHTIALKVDSVTSNVLTVCLDPTNYWMIWRGKQIASEPRFDSTNRWMISRWNQTVSPPHRAISNSPVAATNSF
jgi:hypothetical protein